MAEVAWSQPVRSGTAQPALAGVDPELLHKNPERIRQMFAEVAPRYDLLNRLLSFGMDVRWRRWAARLSPRPLDGPVLDVCCGTGDLALAYWEASGRQASVVGVDFCLPMLRLAARKAERLGAVRHTAWLVADALRLPFPADSFQVVAVAFGIRNVASPQEALTEMTRVCKPGGQVAVLEFSLPSHAALRAVYLWYFRRILPKVGNLVAGSRQNAYSYLPASVGQFEFGEPFLKRFSSVGLADLRMRPLTGGIATLYLGYKPAA
ncbi:MAG: bifunctional demethylmenaquinone methyltransferase/2-methoxy-6-polyprenyl-1,4-benzoquinol methylase UbiE [Thermoguttaceae bacterium]|nr:bifunctional demethylmenaquinone methyltransferase/2-methoxy-6-polyprenyl-1,4-benzoquinol methylase UbiE [Thermoguttaceae bacterium]MDW8078252.1 bifunctional demethylmenaquinone methyltransferase/2-methoxy-6-polyprenyl-1,4-benzoquinol methylase UbiE [Thermoguttaceae bacterium]